MSAGCKSMQLWSEKDCFTAVETGATYLSTLATFSEGVEFTEGAKTLCAVTIGARRKATREPSGVDMGVCKVLLYANDDYSGLLLTITTSSKSGESFTLRRPESKFVTFGVPDDRSCTEQVGDQVRTALLPCTSMFTHGMIIIGCHRMRRCRPSRWRVLAIVSSYGTRTTAMRTTRTILCSPGTYNRSHGTLTCVRQYQTTISDILCPCLSTVALVFPVGCQSDGRNTYADSAAGSLVLQ